MEVKNRKNMIFMVVGAITLIAVTLGATYAYFTAQSADGANIDTNVMTGTTDNLAFSFGDLINIYATEENFAQGMGSISDSTTGQAILKANNTTNEATARYNIYLIIENNDFVYTTENQIPEIVLNVTDPNGKKIENITGLVHYENGFDITTRTGGFLLVPDYEIRATDTQTVQDWNIEVTLVNLDSDQNANTGKSLTGKLYITQDQMSSYELTQINNIITSTTYNSVDATLDITNGSAEVSKYYYGIEKVNNTRSAETVEYIESNESNYKFTNLEPNTEYTIYSYVEDENKIKSNVYETTVETGDFVAPSIKAVSHSETLSSISITVDAQAGSNEIVKYMYSKDNGDSWEESTNNTYTFDNLTDSTEYKIKVKVVDSEGNESPEYYEAITTEIYILPVVNSVQAVTTWNNITLTPSGTDGTNTISKYMYSINDGAYQENNVFGNLSESTSYDIKVKAIDNIGRESNIYEMQVTTDTYKLPTINNVTTSSTKDSITLNVSATNGDGSITTYYYSKDNGSSWVNSTSSSYTFSGLTSNTTFYIQVYVVDSNGRSSQVYTGSVATTSENMALATLNKLGLTAQSTTPNFGSVATSNEGVFTTQDDLGTSYYFRGAVTNNYVYFAGYYWRIIRINGDGTIRMIYDGTSAYGNGVATEARQLADKVAYSADMYDNAYVGYMYGTIGSSNYDSTHANINNSPVKTAVDNWYSSNIANTGYSSKVADAIYCNDRSIDTTYQSGLGYGTNITGYMALYRLHKNKTPQLTCTQVNDRFSTGTSINGVSTNGDLTYPVGLITADEVSMAGGVVFLENASYYLYNGTTYWTMSPFNYHDVATPMFVYDTGSLLSEYYTALSGVRPVISLRNDVTIGGSGTSSNPFRIS